jgi:Rod binding domain-containing protein
MEIPALHSQKIDASALPLESLAGNRHVSEREKIDQASRAFEAVLLRQILTDAQKPAFGSKYVSNTAIDGIYRDVVVNQLAENISKSGALGLARSLGQELQTGGRATANPHAAKPLNPALAKIHYPILTHE